jgi:hypothetical protein
MRTMVGGNVVGLARRPGGVTMLHVRDTRSTDRICVDVREERLNGGGSVEIAVGDSVWWQSGIVLWTPAYSNRRRCGDDFDIQLPKVGYTYGLTHALAGERD